MFPLELLPKEMSYFPSSPALTNYLYARQNEEDTGLYPRPPPTSTPPRHSYHVQHLKPVETASAVVSAVPAPATAVVDTEMDMEIDYSPATSSFSSTAEPSQAATPTTTFQPAYLLQQQQQQVQSQQHQQEQAVQFQKQADPFNFGIGAAAAGAGAYQFQFISNNGTLPQGEKRPLSPSCELEDDGYRSGSFGGDFGAERPEYSRKRSRGDSIMHALRG